MIHAALRRKELFRLERGIYATQNMASEIAIITKKSPHAILTMESAFYYHGFTDDIQSSTRWRRMSITRKFMIRASASISCRRKSSMLER